MSTFTSRAKLLAGGVLASLVCVALTAGAMAQQKASPPDFSSNQAGWLTFRGEFIAVSGGPSPLRNDPAHPVVANNTGAQPTYRIGDLVVVTRGRLELCQRHDAWRLPFGVQLVRARDADEHHSWVIAKQALILSWSDQRFVAEVNWTIRWDSPDSRAQHAVLWAGHNRSQPVGRRPAG